MRYLILTFAISLSIISQYVYSSSDLNLRVDRKVSSEGFLSISWNGQAISGPIVVQIASDPSFNQLVRSIKLTNQNLVHLSGFPDGTYHIRLLEDNQPIQSSAVSFEVKHRQLDDAVALFIIGLSLFVFLIITLYHFNRTSQDH
jgi:hypothetical protein